MTTRTTLTPSQLSKLRVEHPELPDAYLTYLADVGWGEAESHRTIDEGPIAPSEIYGEGRVAEDVVLLGEDFQGYCLAFHRTAKILGEVDPKGRAGATPPTALTTSIGSQKSLDYFSVHLPVLSL